MYKTVAAIGILVLVFASCSNSPAPTVVGKSEPTTAPVYHIAKDSLQKAGPDTCEITCPNCGNRKAEPLPTEVCLISYTCTKCGQVLHPKPDDCCVFCSYGNKKCPSKQ